MKDEGVPERRGGGDRDRKGRTETQRLSEREKCVERKRQRQGNRKGEKREMGKKSTRKPVPDGSEQN